MARAFLRNTGTPRKGNQPHKCDKCGEPIVAGQKRWEWDFRYGGTHRRHADCGKPRDSELTQSRIADLYAAREAVEDALNDAPDSIDAFDAWRDGVAEALGAAADAATEVGDEYREAAEAFGGAGDNADRADECESWQSEMEGAQGNVEGVTIDVDEDEPADETALETLLTDAVSEVTSLAEDACGSLGL